MKARHFLAALGLALVAFTPSAMAAPTAPQEQPTTILTESFEAAPQQYTVSRWDGLEPSTAWWGRINRTNSAHAGSYGLWCAGTLGTWSNYPVGSAGSATFLLPQTASYYAVYSKVWYRMPTLGDADNIAFVVGWRTNALSEFQKSVAGFSKTSAWVQLQLDMTAPVSPGSHDRGGNLSRSAGAMEFQWVDRAEGPASTRLTGEGATIDDLEISGWTYGPVRALLAGRAGGGGVALSWLRPYRDTATTILEERTIVYHVWRKEITNGVPTGSWVQASPPEGWTDTGGVAAHTDATASDSKVYQYVVQAWDAAGGYGMTQQVTLPDSVPPAAPGKPVASGVERTSLTLSWAASQDPGAGVARYDVYDGAVKVATSTSTSVGISGLAGHSTHTYTVVAVDLGGNASASSASTVVVTESAPPVATSDSYSTAEDTPLTVGAPGVLGNDTDADGDPLTASVVANPTHGSLTLNANGSFTYTPAGNYNGSDSFTYRAYDTTAYSNTVTVSISVSAVNDAPVAVADPYSVAEDAALTVAAPGVVANDTDPDGDALTASVVALPTHGTLALAPSGGFVYTPVANYNGPDSFTYRAYDGAAYSNTVAVTLTVTPANDAPAALTDSYSTGEDTLLNVAAPGVLGNDSDIDGGAITASLVSDVVHGVLALSADGSFTYTPATNYTGPDSFSYRAYDGVAYSNTVTVDLDIGSTNDPPVAVADGPYPTPEDTTLSVPASGVLANDTDADSDPLTASVVTVPGHGTLMLNADGSFQYTPAPNYHGADSFTYRVHDGTVYSNTVAVSITVSAVNDSPSATADSWATSEDVPLNVPASGVLANDADADGDPLTASLVSGPTHGSLTLNPNGSFAYTPASNYNGPDSFTYRAYDATVYSNTVTVSVAVSAVNDAPVAITESYSTAEDTARTVAAWGVLANDTDVDNVSLTASVVAPPTHGTLTLNPNGSFTYTPAANYNGPDAFSYHAFDGATFSNTITVPITISAVNDAPVATADSFSTAEDATLTVAAAGVLANDTDADGDDVLSVAVLRSPAHGSLVLAADGSLTYAPASNWDSSDSFTYRVFDGTVYSNTVTVSISVSPVNDAPVAEADAYSVAEDTALSVLAAGVLANDTDIDIDGGTLTALVATEPSQGTLTLKSDGSFTYTPAKDWFGVDSFAYEVADGAGGTRIATVTITVTSVPDTTVIRLVGPTSAPAYGGAFKLTARLSTTIGGIVLSGKTVYFDRLSGSAWVYVGSAVTNSSGDAVRDVPGITSKYTYRARFAGSDPYVASTSAGVAVSPRAYLRNPVAPTSAYRNRAFTVYGYLRPRHTAGTYPVRIYKYRYVSGKWKSYGYVTARAYNYSTYTKYLRAFSLPYAGRWRLRAYAPADGGHAATWSSGYDYITIR